MPRLLSAQRLTNASTARSKRVVGVWVLLLLLGGLLASGTVTS